MVLCLLVSMAMAEKDQLYCSVKLTNNATAVKTVPFVHLQLQFSGLIGLPLPQ